MAGRFERLARDPVYANGVALALNSGIASALGFVYWVLVARRFDSATIGWGGAVVNAATLAALLGKAGFDAAIIRYEPGVSDAHARRMLARACFAAVALTALVAAGFLVLAGHGLSSLAPLRTPSAAAGFLLLACGTALAWIFDAFFIAEQDARFTLYRNVAFNVVKLAAPFAIAGALAAFAVPLSWGVGLAASVLVALPFVPRVLATRRPTAHRPPPAAREVVAYSAKTYVLNVSEFLPGLFLPLLVLEALGPVVNARFLLAWTIATVGFLASKAIAQSSFAELVRDGAPAHALAKGARLSALLLGPFLVLLLVAAPLLLDVLRQGGHADAPMMLRILALSLVPLTVTNLYLSFLKARRAGWELTLLPGAMLVAVVGCAPLALSLSGIVALGWLWLAVQTIAGAYCAVRLAVTLRSRIHHDQNVLPTRLGRRPHEG